MTRCESWGRFPKAYQDVIRIKWRDLALPTSSAKTMLPFGNGRSYGDSCLNHGGVLIHARGLDRFIAFDAQTGTLRCEAGVLLSEILKLAVPHGWFMPVTPGTQFVTIAGALANDVHGKNHHRAGTIGCHVSCFELLRSDGTRLRCSATENPDWFAATIGGLGLTGLITWVELKLKQVYGPMMHQEIIRYNGLDEFFQLSRDSDRTHEHTVAWIDCTAKGRSLGRGLYMRGNHANGAHESPIKAPETLFSIPFDPPFTMLNAPSLRVLNAVYYRKQLRKHVCSTVHYRHFFYPLDAIAGWNKIYGSRGLLQYQCVIPHRNAAAAITEILREISRAGSGSFLAVLKVFGHSRSPGLLSFARPGATLALDFPNQGPRTFDLLDRLDAVTMAADGALYPAKDARMSVQTFRRSYPNWQELKPFIDPQFSSSFWRRVGGNSR